MPFSAAFEVSISPSNVPGRLLGADRQILLILRFLSDECQHVDHLVTLAALAVRELCVLILKVVVLWLPRLRLRLHEFRPSLGRQNAVELLEEQRSTVPFVPLALRRKGRLQPASGVESNALRFLGARLLERQIVFGRVRETRLNLPQVAAARIFSV